MQIPFRNHGSSIRVLPDEPGPVTQLYTHMRWVVAAICAYEVAAIVWDRPERMPTVSRLCNVYKDNPLGRFVVFGSWAWLTHHLFVEE